MYRDNSGIEHESYDAACHYYGVDTPAQLEEEGKWYAEIEAAEALAIAAPGHQFEFAFSFPFSVFNYDDPDLPF